MAKFSFPTINKTSSLGISVIFMAASLVMGVEGYSSKPYIDGAGIVTACWGATKGIKLNKIYTEAECKIMRDKDLEIANDAVIRNVKVKVTEGQRASFISFVYNLGEGRFKNSTMLKLLNAGNYTGACNAFIDWLYIGDVISKGIVKRRVIERDYCLYGESSLKL